jgi:hypothetical protein
MRPGRHVTVLAALVGALAAAGVFASPVHSQEPPPPSVEARVWIDRGADPVVARGDRVRVYYRTSVDAYVAIFHLDTNGTARLVFPASPDADAFVRGGRDYRLLFPPMSSWIVEDDPGVGYYFIVASPDPLDFSAFPYSWQGRSWDLTAVGATVYEDPFLAMDDYIAQMIPDWEYADYTLDWLEYDVGGQHDYPRFLCYDCHGFTPYSVWNPYLSACTSFRMVIFDDPWYYPLNRYRGASVVYVRPTVWRQPRYVFRQLIRGEPRTPLVRPRPADGRLPGVVGSVGPRRSGAGIGSGGTLPATRRGQVSPSRGTRPILPEARRGSSVERSRAILPRTRPTARRPEGGATPPDWSRAGSGRNVTVRPTPGTATTGRPQTRTESRRGGTEVRRPSQRTGTGSVSRTPPTRSSGGGVVRIPPRSPSGGSVTRTPPPRSSGGTVSRPPARSSGGSVLRTRPQRPSGGSVSRTPPARSSGGAVTRRPPRRTSGGSVSRTPPRRSSGGGAARTPPRRSSGGSASRTPPRRSSGGSVSRPPARSSGSSRAAPPRRRGGG